MSEFKLTVKPRRPIAAQTAMSSVPDRSAEPALSSIMIIDRALNSVPARSPRRALSSIPFRAVEPALSSIGFTTPPAR